MLLVHNTYQRPGGEDRVFETEATLLERAGHRVLRYVRDNDDVGTIGSVALLRQAVWSSRTYRDVRTLVESEGVDVVHVHNTLPLVSPSVFRAAHDAGAATVHTLHNYRMVCPNALLMRGGALCHDCVGKRLALPAVQHACYRGSRAATAVLAGTTALHRLVGTFEREVDRYIVLSRFARDLFVEGGLPADRISVKPNALERTMPLGAGGAGALFAGRLDAGKGLNVLLDAWASDPALPRLRIAGDGPMADLARDASASDPRITFLGWQDAGAMATLVSEASMVILPSTCYEGWPLVAVEAMASGTPVVASRHGAFPEMVEEGRSGRLFTPGSAPDLAAAVHALQADPGLGSVRRQTAYASYHARFAVDMLTERLVDIYREAMAVATGR